MGEYMADWANLIVLITLAVCFIMLFWKGLD